MRTTEQLAEIVERVRKATKSLDDQDQRLREIAFEKLLEHELSSAAQADVAHAPSEDESGNGAAPPDSSYDTLQMRADAVARYFKIKPEEAQDIFDLSSEVPTLDLPSNKIEPARAAAVRQITLLICGARTALGLETGSANIREAAEAYGKADTNFMAHLTNFDDKIAVRGKKSSPNRLVRMRVKGAEEAGRVARNLVSNGG